ncbi:uncharacterized protein LOC110978214 isoform X2 [Acanthaster planci]|uniref:Uncharacterized protein LOC110978214 isoform X2 n=1 Tax=Acanthaster planci TaxID=133434 RepID=A0A8B7Y8N6_ACAPL|nr:uncharacterized protein LOC110978214 isoform X2 [Acanthaster planci]
MNNHGGILPPWNNEVTNLGARPTWKLEPYTGVGGTSSSEYDLVFVADLTQPGIFMAPADTFNFTLIPAFSDHVLRPVAIDYDPIDGMVYWTDVQHLSISRAFVDGSGFVVLLRDLSLPDGLSLDTVNRLMYWTDTGSDLIERASMDGLDRSVVLNLTNSSLGTVEPRAIVVDVSNGHLYWTDWGSAPKIERANTDGTSRMVLVNTELQWPNGLTLDKQGGRIYWCDAGKDRIESVTFLGQDRQRHASLETYDIHPFDIALYRGNLYWTDWRYLLINLTLDLPPVLSVISASFSRPGGMHIHSDTFFDHSCVNSMPCGNGERCRQFQTSHQCVCKDGQDGASCNLANPCAASSCYNGGTCYLSASISPGYFCQCRERYFGSNCEIFDDPCNSNPCMNGATCQGTSEGFTCICSSEFLGQFCESQSHPFDLVFVANLDPPGLFVAPTDTFNFTLIPGLNGSHSNISRPVAIDYDPEEGIVYWTDIALSTINRAHLNGSRFEIILSDLQTPDGMTLDVDNYMIYWTDTGSDLIERATMDGQSRSVVLNLTNASLGAVEPRAIVVDPSNNHLYWTDWGSYPRIERSDTDGSRRRVLIDTNLLWPNGLALDMEGGRLYWCDAGLDRIEYSDLLGQGRTILIDLVSLNIHPFDLVYYYDYIYWTDWATNTVLRVDAQGRLATNHGSLSFGKGGGIHVFKDGVAPIFTSGCPNNINQIADDSQLSVPVSWPEVTASDSSLPLQWIQSHQPGDMFRVGYSVLVIYMVTDQAGNSAFCNFTVTVTGVGLDCPSNVTAFTSPEASIANASWVPPTVSFQGPPQSVIFYVGTPPTQATSDTDGLVRVYSDYQPGDTFSVGATRVTYRIQGVGTQCYFYVIAIDKSLPTFVTGCPSNISRLADNSVTSISVSWPEVTASDPSSPLQWTQNHLPGDMFPVGSVTMVTYTVTDKYGNSAQCHFTVIVTGVGLNCPSSIEAVTTPGDSTASASWVQPKVIFNGPPQPVMFYVGTPPTQSTGENDAQVLVYSDHQSGELFGIGITDVTYRIQGLGTQCQFSVTVTVIDTEPPKITGCPADIIIPVKPPSNQVPYSWTPPMITDNSGSANVTFTCQTAAILVCSQSGQNGIFAIGVTEVMYNAVDASGNQDMCHFTITVTGVGLVCPVNLVVDAEPGSINTSVSWSEPDVTGWNGPTNLTSNFNPSDVFLIGSHNISYRQTFAAYGVVLECSFSLQVVGFCAASTTYDPLLLMLTWPVTKAGLTAKSVERCPLMTQNAGDPVAVRNCSIMAPPQYFHWGLHEPRSCGVERNNITLDDVLDVEVSEGNAVEVAEFLVNETSQSSSAENVAAVSSILTNIVNAGSGDRQVTELVVETVNNVANTASTSDSQSIDGSSSSAIIQSVENQVSLTLQQEGRVSIQEESILVEAVSVNPMEARGGLTFVSLPVEQQPGQSLPTSGSLAGTEVKTVLNTSEIPEQVVASIRLPANIVDLIQAGNDNSSQSLRASFIIYADDTLFQSALIRNFSAENGSSLQVAGSVVSLSVEEVELVNLTEPLVIEFKAPDINETERKRTTIQCVFWDFQLNDRIGDWSTAGCVLAIKTKTRVSCNCSHATNFAILVNVKGRMEESHLTRALDIISQVGCVLSIIALGITLVVYLAIRKLRSSKSRQIFMHFCLSLLLLYLVFLAGVDNAIGSRGGCVFVAALLHYLTLSTMMWMAVEARNMYVSTVKVFPEDTRRYMLKASLIAWGSPLIVLIITLAAATDHYQNEHYCFLRPGLVLYIGLLTPIGLILIHNIVTFVLVMRSLLKVKEVSRSQQISKRLQNAVGISVLMGLTWCFGFLAIEEATVAFQLIFCLANSFQGLIVFIMFCVRREEVRTALAPYMKRICCGRTCHLGVPWKQERSYDLQLVSESVPSSPSSVHTGAFDLSVSGPY